MSGERPRDGAITLDAERAAASEADRRLIDAIAAAGADREPPFGWQSRVRAAIAERSRERGHRRRRIAVYLSAAAAAAAVLAVVSLRSTRGPRALELTVTVLASTGAPSRGDEARPGDSLRLVAATAGAVHAELRLYRNDTELLLRCPAPNPPDPGITCRRTRHTLEAGIPLSALGSYQAILLTAPNPLPEPTGDLNRDTQAASQAGATIRLGPPVPVH